MMGISSLMCPRLIFCFCWAASHQVPSLQLCSSTTGDLPGCRLSKESETCPAAKRLRVCVCACSVMSTLCKPLDYIACQDPLSMGFSRQEYWSGLPFQTDTEKAPFPLPVPSSMILHSGSNKCYRFLGFLPGAPEPARMCGAFPLAPRSHWFLLIVQMVVH